MYSIPDSTADSQIRIKPVPYRNFTSGAATLDCKTETLLQF